MAVIKFFGKAIWYLFLGWVVPFIAYNIYANDPKFDNFDAIAFCVAIVGGHLTWYLFIPVLRTVWSLLFGHKARWIKLLRDSGYYSDETIQTYEMIELGQRAGLQRLKPGLNTAELSYDEVLAELGWKVSEEEPVGICINCGHEISTSVWSWLKQNPYEKQGKKCVDIRHFNQ